MVTRSYTTPIQRQDAIMEARFRNATVIISKLVLDISIQSSLDFARTYMAFS
jgi:hypothetical protein